MSDMNDIDRIRWWRDAPNTSPLSDEASGYRIGIASEKPGSVPRSLEGFRWRRDRMFPLVTGLQAAVPMLNRVGVGAEQLGPGGTFEHHAVSRGLTPTGYRIGIASEKPGSVPRSPWSER